MPQAAPVHTATKLLLKAKALATQLCSTLCYLVNYIACQAPLSMEFSRQDYWSGLPFPSPGNLPNPGIEHQSPALLADSLLSYQGSPSPQFSSVQFSHSVVSDSLRPRELQHTGLPCSSPTPRVHTNSRPSSR